MNRAAPQMEEIAEHDPDALYFLPLGGAGEIGMNLNLYGYGGKWLMVDLGVTFGDDSVPGIDVVMPDPAFIVEHKRDLVGLVLTHAHDRHRRSGAALRRRHRFDRHGRS
jgi:ribonuclease J